MSGTSTETPGSPPQSAPWFTRKGRHSANYQRDSEGFSLSSYSIGLFGKGAVADGKFSGSFHHGSTEGTEPEKLCLVLFLFFTHSQANAVDSTSNLFSDALSALRASVVKTLSELAAFDRLSDVSHRVHIKREVVDGVEDLRQQFVRRIKMTQIRA